MPSKSLTPRIQVACLACAPAVGLGITRFAYALLLPDMRHDLSWSFASAGWLNTSNAIGYLIGALLAAPCIQHFGARGTASFGLAACLVSLLLCAWLRDEWFLNLARLLGGSGAGFAYVAAAFAATRIASRHPRDENILIVMLYSGPGFGIVLSGITVPLVFENLGQGSWPVGWAVLAAICAPLSLAVVYGMREHDRRDERHVTWPSIKPMLPLLLGYGLFGSGYIAFMTFMIAFVRGEGGRLVEQAAFWVVLGIAAMVSPFVWASAMQQAKGGGAFAKIGFVTMLGAALPSTGSSPVLIFGSAVIFGGSFFAVVASTTSFVRRNLSPEQWSAAIAFMTVAFSVGQIFGPILSGYFADLCGSLQSGLLLSNTLLALGVVFGMRQGALRQLA